MRRWLICITFLFTVAAFSQEKHPHSGVVKPYVGPPPNIKLTDKELIQVKNENPVYKQLDVDGGGRAFAVFRVNAPPKVVWSVLASYPRYPAWIGNGLTKAKIYRPATPQPKNTTGGRNIFVEFNMQKFPVNYTYYIKHDFPLNDRNWATWTLDYSRKSELSDSVGSWVVNPLKDNPNVSVVSYSIEVAFFGWVPDFIKNMIRKQGLKDATEWVKLQSEERFKA